MPLLERIQVDRQYATADEFNRLQTAIERALQKIKGGSSSSSTVISSTIVAPPGSGGTPASAPPGFDGGEMGDVFGDMMINVPGKDGVIGRDGRPGFGMDGDPGDDGLAGPPSTVPGPAGAPGTNGISNVPGPAGNDGEDGLDGGARMNFSGLPFGAMPAEFDTAGDVLRTPNGDSRIRGDSNGTYYFSRVVAGPYGVVFGTLTIEDNAILMVL